MLKKNELYDRLVDLSNKVMEGKVNPLEIDISKYLDIIRELFKNIENIDDLISDIKALHGLIMILSAQYEILKSRGLGLYIEPVLVELRTRQLSIETIANFIKMIRTPVLELEVSNEDNILRAMEYYRKLPPINKRKYKYEIYEIPKVDIERSLVIPFSIRNKLKRIYEELSSFSNGEWVDYYDFINLGNPVERAYLLSFLISEGFVEMVYKRFDNRIFIRPVKNVKAVRMHSIAASIIRGEYFEGED